MSQFAVSKKIIKHKQTQLGQTINDHIRLFVAEDDSTIVVKESVFNAHEAGQVFEAAWEPGK